jgi:catechol 2,3-dioxygenase-like lactoylglutathione lyase family enzyme
MSRVQLALNVTKLDAAIDFYSKLFGTEPAKRKPGYANFEIADPPLKLVLLQSSEGGTLNHLGVETDTAAEVVAAEARLTDTGLATTGVDETVCCFAEKVETWVNDPDGAPWEWYVKTADSDDPAGVELDEATGSTCCATSTSTSAPVSLGAKAGTSSGCG